MGVRALKTKRSSVLAEVVVVGGAAGHRAHRASTPLIKAVNPLVKAVWTGLVLGRVR